MRYHIAASLALIVAQGLCADHRVGAAEPLNGEKISSRWALLIGVDDYLWARKLDYCGADVKALGAQLVSSGFPNDHVYLLHDKAEESRYRPMKGNIEAHLRLILGLVGQEDLLVVGFSGHGLHINGKSYLCPAEAKLESAETLISMDDVYERLQKCPAALKLFVVDACRNDPHPDGERSFAPVAGTRQFAQSLERPPQGILLLTSCAPGEVAREEKEFGHGVFMHFLLEGLQGAADVNGNGRVSLMKLYLYTNDKTKSYVARKFFDSQRPSLKGDIHDDFDLVQVASVSPGTVPARTMPARSQSAPSPSEGHTITNSIGMKLALIPAGEFLMGSSAKDIKAWNDWFEQQENLTGANINREGPQHRVRITRPFYLGTYHVTRGQFRQFVEATGYKTAAEEGENPGAHGWNSATGKFEFDARYSWQSVGFEQTDEHPVVCVSWNDAVAFCEWLSGKEGESYRLPTEAEWECACRAESTTRYCFGNDEDEKELGDYAWYKTNSGEGTHSVGRKRANACGLYDMHGSICQWCADWCDFDYYAASPMEDPKGPDSGSYRAARGGSWNDPAGGCRSAYRYAFKPWGRGGNLGFRVARVAK